MRVLGCLEFRSAYILRLHVDLKPFFGLIGNDTIYEPQIKKTDLRLRKYTRGNKKLDKGRYIVSRVRYKIPFP